MSKTPPLQTFSLRNAHGHIMVAEYGGQLLHWQCPQGVERLYTPEHLHLAAGRALRGVRAFAREPVLGCAVRGDADGAGPVRAG